MRAISSVGGVLCCVGGVLCCVGGVLCTHSFRYPNRKKSRTVVTGERAGHGVSPKRELTLWKRIRTTSVLQCHFLARFIPNFFCLCPGCVSVADLSNVDCAEMFPLLCEMFSIHSSWSTMRAVPYSASVFKLTYPQKNSVARRNRTMPRNIKMLPKVTLCPNDGLCLAIKAKICSSLRYTALAHCD
jgi:hypothetical protein